VSRSPRPLALLAAAFGVGILAHAAPSAADAPADSKNAPDAKNAPVIVLLAPNLELTDVDDRAVGTLGARVRATGIKVVVVRRPVAELRALAADSKALIATWSARGALWIDVGRPDEAALYLVTRDGEQIFGRTIPAPEGKTSATLETLANIAASVSEELLEGRIVELSPVKVPEPDPPLQRTASVSGPEIAPEPERAPAPKPSAKTEVTSPPAPRPREAPAITAPASPSDDAAANRYPRLGLSVGYTGDTFGSTIPWQSAVSALVALSPSPSTHLGLGYDFVIPVRVDSFPGGYRLARHPIVVRGSYRLLFSQWDLGLGARMAMDILEKTPLRRPPPEEISMPPPPTFERRTEILFTAAPVLEFGFSFAGRFRAGAFLGVELLLNKSAPTEPRLHADPARIITGLSLSVDILVPTEGPRPRTAGAAPNDR
jgi:hypothetical protein